MAITRLSTWCALRCADDQLFWRFLGATNKAEAVDIVLKKCGVKSRSKFDKDPAARARFDEIIRFPYTDFYNRHQA